MGAARGANANPLSRQGAIALPRLENFPRRIRLAWWSVCRGFVRGVGEMYCRSPVRPGRRSAHRASP